jgi:hypothetical protein
VRLRAAPPHICWSLLRIRSLPEGLPLRVRDLKKERGGNGVKNRDLEWRPSPKLIKAVDPVYPADAKKTGVESVVILAPDRRNKG